MAQQEKTPVGFWAWEPAGKPLRILIDLDLVENMLTAILDGFGSIPRRGAEIGGILLGSRSRNASGQLEVTIDGWSPVPCSHRFGPSFVLSEADLAALEAIAGDAGPRAVGYFRSHTREGLSLSAEDLQYCEKYFPGPDDVVLLVHPAAIQVSKAGFFAYENGALQDKTPLEFNFRRSELETGGAPPRRPLGEKREPAASAPPSFEPPVTASAPREPRKHGMEGIAGIAEAVAARDPHAAGTAAQASSAGTLEPLPHQRQPYYQQPHGGGLLEPSPHPLLPYASPSAITPGRIRKNWVWFPLSFVFLLLGVLLGFQAALVFTAGKTSTQDPYALSMGVERRGDDLVIRWDRSNPAVRTASKGVLEITDGRYTKRVDLDSSQLQTGSVIYRFSSSDLRFRLEVQPKDRTVIIETVNWKNK